MGCDAVLRWIHVQWVIYLLLLPLFWWNWNNFVVWCTTGLQNATRRHSGSLACVAVGCYRVRASRSGDGQDSILASISCSLWTHEIYRLSVITVRKMRDFWVFKSSDNSLQGKLENLGQKWWGIAIIKILFKYPKLVMCAEKLPAKESRGAFLIEN